VRLARRGPRANPPGRKRALVRPRAPIPCSAASARGRGLPPSNGFARKSAAGLQGIFGASQQGIPAPEQGEDQGTVLAGVAVLGHDVPCSPLPSRRPSLPPGREGLPGMPERQRRPMPEEEWERAQRAVRRAEVRRCAPPTLPPANTYALRAPVRAAHSSSREYLRLRLRSAGPSFPPGRAGAMRRTLYAQPSTYWIEPAPPWMVFTLPFSPVSKLIPALSGVVQTVRYSAPGPSYLCGSDFRAG